jgi:transglutaminase-like putative cysteine protease
MNRYSLTHVTQFDYNAPVTDSYNEVRLRPLQADLQSCLSFRLTIDPPAAASAHVDYYGNTVHRFNVLREHRRLRIEAKSVVLVQSPIPLPAQSVPLGPPDSMQEALDEYYDFLRPTDYIPHDPGLRELGARAESECDGTCAGFAAAAMRVVHQAFRYEKGATHVHSSICDTLGTGAGVCQDFAHILLGLVRVYGLPGRYVSGYLVPLRVDEEDAGVEEVIGGQASHAWMEVFIPDAGWFALDPTLGVSAGLQHVRVAYGRDYGDVAPIRGVYKGNAGQHMSVDVGVRPALDNEGCEHLQEPLDGSMPVLAGPPQQPQQQQQ